MIEQTRKKSALFCTQMVDFASPVTYGDIWILVQSVCVGKILNCKHEGINPQNLYTVGLRKYGTTVGHVLCVIPCIWTLFFNKAWQCHRSTLTGPSATVLIPKTCHREVQDCLDCDILFGKELCVSRLNEQYKFFVHSYVARCEKRETFWITFIHKISTAKIMVPCVTVKHTCHKKFRVYGKIFIRSKFC